MFITSSHFRQMLYQAIPGKAGRQFFVLVDWFRTAACPEARLKGFPRIHQAASLFGRSVAEFLLVSLVIQEDTFVYVAW